MSPLALRLAPPPRPLPWEDMPSNKHTGLPMAPRRWQAEALPRIGESLRRGERPVVVACTGAGKAVLLTEVVRLMAWTCGPSEVVVVSAPTVALVRQLVEDLTARCGPVGVYYGGAKRLEARIVVVCNASAPRLVADLAGAGRTVRLWLADEAHKTETDGMRVAIEGATPRFLVGFTATPFRSTGCTYLQLFSEVAYRYLMDQAIGEGVLVPYDPVNSIDGGEIDAVCLDLIRSHGHGPGVVGATTIPDAVAYATYLTERGVPAEAIHSGTPDAERKALVEALRSGRLRCLVHVALLIEGVDFPWLAWLCLRRPIGSMLALIQQLGRVLRSYPNKTRAIVLDPHDLLGTFGLSAPENIGVAEEEIARQLEKTPSEDREDGPPKPPPEAVAVSEATQWVRRAMLEMVFSGALPDIEVRGSAWRSLEPSDKQMNSLSRMHKAWARHLPDRLQAPVRALVRGGLHVQRGAVSDVLSILHAVARQAPQGGWEARRTWRGPVWPSEMEIPEAPAWMR